MKWNVYVNVKFEIKTSEWVIVFIGYTTPYNVHITFGPLASTHKLAHNKLKKKNIARNLKWKHYKFNSRSSYIKRIPFILLIEGSIVEHHGYSGNSKHFHNIVSCGSIFKLNCLWKDVTFSYKMTIFCMEFDFSQLKMGHLIMFHFSMHYLICCALTFTANCLL